MGQRLHSSSEQTEVEEKFRLQRDFKDDKISHQEINALVPNKSDIDVIDARRQDVNDHREILDREIRRQCKCKWPSWLMMCTKNKALRKKHADKPDTWNLVLFDAGMFRSFGKGTVVKFPRMEFHRLVQKLARLGH